MISLKNRPSDRPLVYYFMIFRLNPVEKMCEYRCTVGVTKTGNFSDASKFHMRARTRFYKKSVLRARIA